MIEKVEVVEHGLTAGLLDEADGLGHGGMSGSGLLQGLGNGRVGHFEGAGDAGNCAVRQQQSQVSRRSCGFKWLHFSFVLLPLNEMCRSNVGNSYQMLQNDYSRTQKNKLS